MKNYLNYVNYFNHISYSKLIITTTITLLLHIAIINTVTAEPEVSDAQTSQTKEDAATDALIDELIDNAQYVPANSNQKSDETSKTTKSGADAATSKNNTKSSDTNNKKSTVTSKDKIKDPTVNLYYPDDANTPIEEPPAPTESSPDSPPTGNSGDGSWVYVYSGIESEDGFYFDIGIGQSSLKNYTCSGCVLNNIDTDYLSKSIQFGYRLDKNYAFTFGYIDLNQTVGKGTGLVDEITVAGFKLSALALYPVNAGTESFDLYGKFGLFIWSQDNSFTNLAPSSFTGTSLTYGIGINYYITKTDFRLYFEWDTYKDVGTNDQSHSHINDIDVLSIGVGYKL